MSKDIEEAGKDPAEKPFTKEEKAEISAEKSEKDLIAKIKKSAKKSEKTIKILKPLSGTFLMSDTVGEIVNKESKLADVIIDSGRAKEV